MSLTTPSVLSRNPFPLRLLPLQCLSSKQLHHLTLKAQFLPSPSQQRSKRRSLICRAELAQDAPFAMAIGACVLNSLVFPIGNSQKEEDEDGDGDGGIDSTDARFAVMGIISLIPYFNWLSWVFAWLDTNKSRYVVYSLVYLAPYVRTNLSLSPEDSWLPIASIIMCIIHIQLEASIQNGDLQGFQLFNEALKFTKGANGHQERPKKGRKKERTELPSAQEQSRNELRGWGVPEKPVDLHLEEDEDSEGSGKP